MRGYIDHITSTSASGWVLDQESGSEKMQVRLTLADRVDRSRGSPISRGRMLARSSGRVASMVSVSPPELSRPRRSGRLRSSPSRRAARTGSRCAVVAAARRRHGQYQTFDDAKGGSKSTEKLQALRLPLLRNRHSEARPLKNLSVLDIGCNEGFFCGEALRQGARRVVGIDMSRGFLDRRPTALSGGRVLATAPGGNYRTRSLT